VEKLCAPFYAERIGRPSLAPGRYFRLLLIGYFEGLESERAIAWRTADSFTLSQFCTAKPKFNAAACSKMRLRMFW
jgi:transposase